MMPSQRYEGAAWTSACWYINIGYRSFRHQNEGMCPKEVKHICITQHMAIMQAGVQDCKHSLRCELSEHCGRVWAALCSTLHTGDR